MTEEEVSNRENTAVILADGSEVKINRSKTVHLELNGYKVMKQTIFLLPSTPHIILGMDVLQRCGYTCVWKKKESGQRRKRRNPRNPDIEQQKKPTGDQA
ncbi:unnamed protein product, partial [Trichogramma brassicae]